MCLITFAFNVDPQYPLLLAANRDEFHARPAAKMGWWADRPNVLAGRDLREGGSWLGVSRSGRAAAVTNVRIPSDMSEKRSRSRGVLISDYLSSGLSADEYVEYLRPSASEYGAFNLLLYAHDDRSLRYVSNVPAYQSKVVSAGVHALSNAQLDTPWPKARAVTQAMREWVLRGSSEDESMVLAAMRNPARATDAELPETGVALELERMLSSAFIVSPEYGTRCTTFVRISDASKVSLREIRFDTEGNRIGDTTAEFEISA